MNLVEQMAASRVIPVVTAHDVPSTVKLAAALSRGGMRCIEITLRTEAALDAIRAVKTNLPNLVVAAGTVISAADMARAEEAGAEIFISPGISRNLLDASLDTGVPFLPGVATASEVMLGLELGFDFFKFFPAAAAGGIELLKSLSGPFPQVRFCPTGGLGPENYRQFLALPNVICCGGSWMVAEALVQSGNWEEVEALSRAALGRAA